MKDKYFSYMRLQMILCMILFCGWWGFLYPQLVLPEGTYRITYAKEDTDSTTVSEYEEVNDKNILTGHTDVKDDALTGEELLKELESNKENRICIKSRFLTMLQEFLWENDDE